MKTAMLLATLALFGCQISPVISDPRPQAGDRYADCRRAARDYCRHAADTSNEAGEQDSCVARATYECVSGTPEAEERP